ncbi:hypothetical protein B6U80_02590 [Candidatus Pacearchaeota archaeon ex4484_26]|nr:MAG: hypothetical protein B6U80_02590 [Candidatus Pacearchaeota archaeon ex4484_26]
MLRTPCEIILWGFLPALRKELVKAMIKKGVKRKEIAKIFGLSEAAICQYLKSKRGTDFKFTQKAKKQIEKAAERMVNLRGKEVINEICELCLILRKGRSFCKQHKLLCLRKRN